MTLENLIELLKTANNINEIDIRRTEIKELLPEIEIMFDYNQQNSAHQFDLWLHSLHTVINLPRKLDDNMLYLAALLHDIGKPACQCRGKKENDLNMHYWGHPDKSMEIVRDEIVPTICAKGIVFLKEDIKSLLYYVKYHDDHVSLDLKQLKKHFQIASLQEFQKLMLLQVADAKAHVQIPMVAERKRICEILAGDYTVQMYVRIKAGEEKG